jgi:uncharacterized protein (TIGR03067 family)
MRLLWIIVTMLSCQHILAGSATSAEEKNQEVLKGEWRLVGWEDSGFRLRPGAAEDLTDFRIKAGEMTICGKGRDGEDTRDKATIKIDPSKSPKQIDLTVREGVRKGQVLRGVYLLKENKLFICINADGKDPTVRPKAFSTAPKDGNWLLTFEAVEKK